VKELLTLAPYLRKYVVHIGVGLLLVIIANAFALAPPFLIKEAIDDLGTPEASRAALVRYALLIIGAAVVGGAARYGMRELLNGVSRRVEFDLRNDLFHHLLRLDSSFYGRTETGEIMSRATNDIAAVRMVAGPAYMYLVNTIVVSLFAVSLMAWISPGLTLLAMIPMLALPPTTLGFGTLIHRRFEAIQERFGTISTLVQENLAGVRIVKAYSHEERQTERFRGLAEDYLERNLSLARVSGLFHPLLGLLSGIALAGVLLLGGRAVVNGGITIGDFVAFTLYLGMLTWPMIALGWVVSLFQRGAASMRRINQILGTAPAVQDPAHPHPVGAPRGEIEFRNVHFRYPGTSRDVLHDVSFRAAAGEMLAVVGHTGSGKSTLAALIVRLYDPTSGEVLLDGVPVREIPLDELRSAIGMVPQDAFLFSETIRRNLAIGIDEDSSPEAGERIAAAARTAQLDRTIDELPAGYDTLLGERGVNLSGGQKQRATLARAIARDPRVLILDDALSAVDTHTEIEILRGLRTFLRERTSVVVSHRASAVRDADLILVLEGGRIVERGVHDELIGRQGTYANLVRRQLLEEEVGEAGVLAGPRRDL
jgi:ATP-binding cassette, subfamily B, multidrug efflux pump